MLTASKILAPVLLAAAAVGSFGVWNRLVVGEETLALGSYVPWGLWIGLYVYFVGISGGAFLLVFLHYGLGIAALRRPARYALPVAVVTLGAGLFLVTLDLGQMFRVWQLFTRPNPSSILTVMLWVYTLYGVVLLGLLVAVLGGHRNALRRLSYVGMVLVIIFTAGEGALFGVVAGNPIWHSGLFPLRFLLSALLSGVGLVAFVTVLFQRWPSDAEALNSTRLLRLALLGLLAVNLFAEISETSLALYAGVPAVVGAYEVVLFGQYWWLFWGVQIGLGLVFPAIILLSALGRTRWWLATAGVLVAVGLAGSKQNIVLAGLALPDIEGLPAAFNHARLSHAYFPSPTEWLVAVGVTAAAGLAFIAAIELFPFLRTDEQHGPSSADIQRGTP
jgi:protein NrfD